MYRIITITGVLLTLLAIVAGVLTRLLENGLLLGQIPAQSIHIYLAYAVVGTAGLLTLTSWWQIRMRTAAITSSLLLLLVIAIQVMMGIFLFQHPDQHRLVSLHYVSAILILGLFFRLWLRSNKKIIRLTNSVGPAKFTSFSIAVLLLQMVLGGLVSVHQAGMVCAGFPLCQGQWWPQADYTAMFNVFNADTMLALDGQLALNWLHRIGALICLVLWMALMLATASQTLPGAMRRSGLWLGFLLFTEIGLGIAFDRLGMPLWVAVAHGLCAALLILPLIALRFYSRFGFAEDDIAVVTKLNKAGASADKSEADVALEHAPGLELTPHPVKTPIEDDETYVEPASESVFLRLKSQLTKTRFGLGGLFASNRAITDELLEDIEANLLVADVGIDVASKIINKLTQKLDKQQLTDSNALTSALKDELFSILQPCSEPLVIPKQDTPFVILVVGVNGVGKTTTIGKLANRLQAQGHSVMLAAGDTFRAAAVEQLQAWGERNNIPVIAQQTGADSASVIFDGIQSAQAKGVDVLIADTAGRLHTKSNLMEELKKVKRIMSKLDETAPHEVLLVVDAGTGQNALSQAKQFNAAVELTGIALTKLDGTAKGGVIFALAKQTGIPIRFIGVGESIEDLQDFDAQTFIDALFVTD